MGHEFLQPLVKIFALYRFWELGEERESPSKFFRLSCVLPVEIFELLPSGTIADVREDIKFEDGGVMPAIKVLWPDAALFLVADELRNLGELGGSHQLPR